MLATAALALPPATAASAGAGGPLEVRSGSRPLRDSVPYQNSVVSPGGRALARMTCGVMDITNSDLSRDVV